MTCADFLARYSEYLDEMLDPLETARWGGHVSQCGRCAHYDRVMRRGLHLVREMPMIEPAPDFHARLQRRLDRDVPIGFERAAPAAGVMLSLAVAGIIALIAWSPLLRTSTEPDGAGAPVAAGLVPAPAARQAAAPPDWWSEPARPMAVAGYASRSLPGPYSPLLVAGPAYRPGDVSFTLAPLVE